MTTLSSRAAFLPIVLAAAASGDVASFTGLGFLPGMEFGRSSAAQGVSSDGLVVTGYSTSSVQQEPFRWTRVKGLVGLGFEGAGRAISGNGKVIVGDDGSAAFMWTDPKNGGHGKVSLGDLPGGFSAALTHDLSSDGSTAVGQSSGAKGLEAFRWTSAGGMVGLGDLAGGVFESGATGVSADGSVIVGFGSNSMGVLEAFIWNDPARGGDGMTGLGDLPGGGYISSALAVSADGKTAVGQASSAKGPEAFRWTKSGGMVALGDLSGGDFESRALAVSDDGSVIVGEGDSADGLTAFVWTESGGMVKLIDLLKNDGADLTGWKLRSARAVSADGSTVVGVGDHNGLLEGFIATIAIGGGGCYADFTGDGALDLFDFLAFVNEFNAQDPAADCDNNGGLDLFDFLCFTNGFNAGCP
jgi:probable HAF family extracellular repeat protein